MSRYQCGKCGNGFEQPDEEVVPNLETSRLDYVQKCPSCGNKVGGSKPFKGTILTSVKKEVKS